MPKKKTKKKTKKASRKKSSSKAKKKPSKAVKPKYSVPLKNFKDAKVTPKAGEKIILEANNKEILAVITEVGKKEVIVQAI